MKILNKRNLARVKREAKATRSGNLYQALHHVGDDATKVEIEDTLKELLDDVTFRRVVAVFMIATEDT